MSRHIVIIQGHPDPGGQHLGRALADSYARGAGEGGHDVRTIEVAQLDFPLLRTAEDYNNNEPPEVIREAQRAIGGADHLVIVYPLWMGTMPAILKGFMEQVFRPGFAMSAGDDQSWPRKLLKGKSARIIVTMGMPVWVYRWYFRAHSLKSLERNVLGFCGIRPIRESLFGLVENASDKRRQAWLDRLRELGRTAK